MTDTPPAGQWTPKQVIDRIADVAEAVGWQAGVGASETAGLIVSVLSANHHLIDRFMAEGSELFIDGSIRAEAGRLTFLSIAGEVLTPAELVRRTQGDGALQ